MHILLTAATVLSSVALRFSSWIFLRWIPGHDLPPLIIASALMYFTCITINLGLPGETATVNVNTSKSSIVDPSPSAPSSRAADSQKVPNEKPSLDKLSVADRCIQKRMPKRGQGTQIWNSLLLGLPCPESTYWTASGLGINLLLCLFCADLLLRAPFLHPSHGLSFARVGFVSEHSANILVREPNTARLPIYISYRRVPSPSDESSSVDDAWKSAGQIYWLSEETDFTQPLNIPQLRPSSRYQYVVSTNHSGFFTTAPKPGQTHPNVDKFTFLTSSCLKPHFPYSPIEHPLSIPGLKHLAKWIPSVRASFMLFLGDFIYVDVPHRFGSNVETYRREYRQVYASPDWPGATDSLPWLHVLDDHEIANDWDHNTTDPYSAAIDPFSLYQGSVNPPRVSSGASYFQFTQGPASFFLMDTRRFRTSESVADAWSPSKSMLGSEQLASLLDFLSRRDPRGVKWKIIVSSVPFTRNWRFNSADTWAGYLHERQIILETMWDVGLRGDGVGVVILSGDRHEFAATAFPPPKAGRWPLSATVHEFSTSPLSMFYLPIRTYSEVADDNEPCIKYIPDGNSKFGAVEMTNLSGGEQSLLKFTLFVDGEETWSYVITSPPTVVGRGRGKDAVWG